MGARTITPAQKDHYWTLRAQGYSIVNAAREAGFSPASAKGFEKKRGNGQDYRKARQEQDVPDFAIPLDDVCDAAKEALADRTGFLFVKRYMGLELSPWQQEAWEVMEELWESGDREFLAENAPPGGGKSTKGVGFAAKLIVLDRSVRTLFISRAQSLAERNTMRVRRLLERTSPAVGAESTLSADFGRFRPRQGGDVWKRNEFVVEQADGSPIEEKEPTCSAFGFDSEWLGNRIDFVFGDDLDSTKTIRNLEIVEKNRDIFDNELEPRLEPGGLFMIAQQRLGPFDFSGHALGKVTLPDDDGSDEDPQGVAQYRRVVFKVHYEDRCQGIKTHRAPAPSYPDGCLLDPVRMPWRDIRKAMNNPTRFKVVYQQEDATESDALVHPIWIDGGLGPNGEVFPGCWDFNRGLAEVPKGLTLPLLSIATADPSPTRYWAIEWWAHHPETGQWFLLDLIRQVMDAPDFLDWDHSSGAFTGVMEEWQTRSNLLGAPITHWIVEANAAQRFMLQYQHTKRWMAKHRVSVIAHQTHLNKLSAEYGVQTLAPLYRNGLVRLPGKQGDPGRPAAMKLKEEVIRWPYGTTDDCLMAQWFGVWNVPKLTKKPATTVKQWRPSWLTRSEPALVRG